MPSSVCSTLFSRLWTSSTVPVAVLPSSTSATLTEQSVSEDISFSVPGRASQDVSVFMRLSAPAQARRQYCAISEQPCDARCCSCTARAPTLLWRSAICTSSTNEESSIPQTPRFQSLTFKTTLSGSGTKCGVVRGLWNASLLASNASVARKCCSNQVTRATGRVKFTSAKSCSPCHSVKWHIHVPSDY